MKVQTPKVQRKVRVGGNRLTRSLANKARTGGRDDGHAIGGSYRLKTAVRPKTKKGETAVRPTKFCRSELAKRGITLQHFFNYGSI